MDKNKSIKFSSRIILLFTFIIGYEWLMSGLSKLLSHSFVSGFHHQISSSLGDAYGFYDPILKNLVIPNAIFFGYLIEFGELFIGIVFVLISLLGFVKMTPVFAKFGMVASIFSAFLSFNIFFFTGDPFFVVPSSPFSESVSLDLLLAVMQLTLFVYFYKLNKAKLST